MPSVTGRICSQPCERACNRASFDEPVSIRSIERMVGDARDRDEAVAPFSRTKLERVAVVGSGPAGLAAAWHLARSGYGVTLFEADPEPGGALRWEIPAYRLPADVLARDIARIAAGGVEIRCGVRIGRDLPWSDLDVFDAVLVSTGAAVSRRLGFEPAQEIDGLISAADFLRALRCGRPPEIGRRVAVIGDDDSAVDCARSAIRMGSRVTILPGRTTAAMAANPDEVDQARREGVLFAGMAAPIGLRAPGGKIEGLDCRRLSLTETRAPLPWIENSPGVDPFFLAADTVIVAVGQSPDLDSLPETLARGGGHLAVDRFGATSRRSWFACGEVCGAPPSVASALGSGKRAALAIDHFLRAEAGEAPETMPPQGKFRFGRTGNVSAALWRDEAPPAAARRSGEVVPFDRIATGGFSHVSRNPDRWLPLERATRSFDEIDGGLPSAIALREAKRCFGCGVCDGCDMCIGLCPETAISKSTDGSISIDLLVCRGCGICATECPRGVIAMIPEGADELAPQWNALTKRMEHGD